jgi:hypothetical protein
LNIRPMARQRPRQHVWKITHAPRAIAATAISPIKIRPFMSRVTDKPGLAGHKIVSAAIRAAEVAPHHAPFWSRDCSHEQSRLFFYGKNICFGPPVTLRQRGIHRLFSATSCSLHTGTLACIMADADPNDALAHQIEHWRNHVRRDPAGQPVDVAKRERQLRDEIAGLTRAGLAPDEAFLIAVKRLGSADSASRDLADKHSAGVWKQVGMAPPSSDENRARARQDAFVAFGLATLAAVAVKAPALFGIPMHDGNEGFYLRNASLFVLPCLIGYFVWKRQLAARTICWLTGAIAVAAVFANLPGFGRAHAFEPLTALHLPIALSLAVGIAYAGGRWSQVAARMNFIRFSGELFIYYVLIALGGGVLTAFMVLTFKSIGVNIEHYLQSWQIPCGAAGAVVVASWLVEAKQGMIGAIAPMLTRLFTPLFAAMLLAFLGTVLWSGRGIATQRELLIGFDLLLVVVLGLLLYSLAARDPQAPPGAFDWVQVVLVIAALLANAVALWAIVARIDDFGFTPNRVAALGENVILLVNLAWSAVVYVRFLIGRGSFQSLERWQTGYIPIYSAWAAIVVIGFPLAFRFF